MDPADLAHNRRGALGPGQRAQIAALIASYGPVRFALGAAADTGRAFVAQLRQSLDDGRVVAATSEIGVDLAAFRAGVAEGRVFDLPGNFESAYVAAIDGGGYAKLASWINVLPGRYAIYRATPVGLVVGVEPLPPPDHALRFFRLLCAAQSLTAEVLTENRRGRIAAAQRAALQLADERVEALDGPLQKSISVTRQSTVARTVEIGARSFTITDRAELYAVLVPGFVYRAYVTPRSGRLLAVELAPQ